MVRFENQAKFRSDWECEPLCRGPGVRAIRAGIPGTYEVGVGRTFANIGDVPWVLTPSALALNLFGIQTPLPEPHGQEILVNFPAHARGLLQHEFS